MAQKEQQKIAATIEEAVENAGTTRLSHGSGGVRTLTRDEVTELEKENPQEVLGYAGPFADLNDGRNVWTAEQDAGETRTKQLVEEAQQQKKDEDQKKKEEGQRAKQQQPVPPELHRKTQEHPRS